MLIGKNIKKDANARLRYVRRINDDTISRGNVDDFISERIRSGGADVSNSPRRQSDRLQLQTPQGEPEHNQGRISSENEESSENIKFSLKDSEGKTLTSSQIEYFKNSKIRDENGNLLVVYHGITSGEWDEDEAQYARKRRDPLIDDGI